MATIDIRNESKDKTDTIRFADDSGLPGANWGVTLCSIYGDFVMVCTEYEERYVGIRKGDVQNLIRALQKAVKLGWTE